MTINVLAQNLHNIINDYTSIKVKQGNVTQPDFKAQKPKNEDYIENIETELQYTEQIYAGLSGVWEVCNTISQNEKSLGDIGCVALKSIASKAKNKVTNVSESALGVLKGLASDLKKVLNDKNLSEEEKESKINMIMAKKDAIIAEAEAKADALLKISDMLTTLLPAFLDLKSMGINTDEFTESLITMIDSINVAPSNLNDAKNPDDVKKLSKENLKNIFGANSKDFVQKNIQKFDIKIDKLKEKLTNKDLSKQEKTQAQAELKVCKEIRNFFAGFSKQVSP